MNIFLREKYLNIEKLDLIKNIEILNLKCLKLLFGKKNKYIIK